MIFSGEYANRRCGWRNSGERDGLPAGMGRCDGDECRKVRGNSEWNGGAIHATQVINSKLIEEIVEIEQNLLGFFKVAHYHESWRPNDFVIAALNHYDQFSTFHSTLKISSNICCIFIMVLFIRRIIFQLICASQTFSYANHFTSYISWAVQIITKPESFRISNLVSLFRFYFFPFFLKLKMLSRVRNFQKNNHEFHFCPDSKFQSSASFVVVISKSVVERIFNQISQYLHFFICFVMNLWIAFSR